MPHGGKSQIFFIICAAGICFFGLVVIYYAGVHWRLCPDAGERDYFKLIQE